jgi:hypothetical protein
MSFHHVLFVERSPSQVKDIVLLALYSLRIRDGNAFVIATNNYVILWLIFFFNADYNNNYHTTRP